MPQWIRIRSLANAGDTGAITGVPEQQTLWATATESCAATEAWGPESLYAAIERDPSPRPPQLEKAGVCIRKIQHSQKLNFVVYLSKSI